MTSNGAKEIIGTATVSFLLGWAFKKYNLFQIFKNFKNFPGENTKLVVIVRSDLPMTKGKVAAQCSHAAVSCYKEGMAVCPEIVKKWETKGQPKIILRADSEQDLRKLAKQATDAGLIAALIRDAGRTEVPSGTATVLGIGPGYINQINQITGGLKIL